MDDVSETNPLLVNSQTVTGSEEKFKDSESAGNISSAQVILRICLILAYMAASELGSLNQTLYIYEQVSEITNDNNLTSAQSSISQNFTGNACGQNQTRDSEHRDQQQAAIWNWYFNLVSYGVGIPFLILFGLYSDFIGRKPILVISLFTTCLRYGIMAFINYRHLSLTYFFIFYALTGVTGENYLFYLALVASIADKTKYDQTRTLGMVGFDLLIGLGRSLSKLSAGYLVHYIGNLLPMLIVSGSCLFLTFIVYLSVEETMVISPGKTLTCFGGLKRMFGFFYDKTTVVGNTINAFVIFWIAFIIIDFARVSTSSVITFYEIRSPICWNSKEIGWYGFASDMLEFVGGTIAMKILQYCFQDETIVVFGCISNIGLLAIQGVASNGLMMYAAIGIGMLSVLPFPLLRAIMSRLVHSDRQGILFANIYVIENMCHLLSGTVFNNVYSKTEDTMPGLVFIIGASIFIVPILLLICLICLKVTKNPDP